MTESAERKLDTFIAKFSDSDQVRIREIRKALRERFPAANELVYDNYNFFVIGYSPTERPSDAVVSMAAKANGVGLCFIHGASLPDPHKILLGAGKQTRFVDLVSASTLSEPAVEEMIVAALKHAKVPMPKSGNAKLIIRSVAANQRPRKKDEAKGAVGGTR